MKTFTTFITLLITCAVTSGLPVPRGERSRSRREAEGSRVARQTTVFRVQSLMLGVSDHATLVHKHFCQLMPEACFGDVTLPQGCVHGEISIVVKLNDPQSNLETLLRQLEHFYDPILASVESFRSHHATSTGLCSPDLIGDPTSHSLCQKLESLTNSLSSHLVPYVRRALGGSIRLEGEGGVAGGHVRVVTCDAAMLKALVTQTDSVLTILREEGHHFV